MANYTVWGKCATFRHSRSPPREFLDNRDRKGECSTARADLNDANASVGIFGVVVVKSLNILVCLMFVGCAHHQLNRNTLQQASVLSELYEQQVLTNLAMLSENPGSTPSFGLPNGGGTNLQHANTLNGGLNWNAFAFTGANLGLNGSRAVMQNWTLTPINDPRRLKLMKCAYQQAIDSGDSNCNLDCNEPLNRFLQSPKSMSKVPGRFFCVSEKAPNKSGCCNKVGEYCGCYVVVTKENFSSLSELTFVILEIATLPDAEIDNRLNPPATEAPTVDITESFIRIDSGGAPRLIQGSYQVDANDFKSIYRKNALPFKSLSMLSQDAVDAKAADASKSGSFDINDVNILPRPSVAPLQLNGLPRGQDPTSRIEALLQFNATPMISP